MRNPFEDLGKPKLENPQGEEVGGAFTCQVRDCWSTVSRARYLEEIKVLTWKCEEGHINQVEDFRIDG